MGQLAACESDGMGSSSIPQSRGKKMWHETEERQRESCMTRGAIIQVCCKNQAHLNFQMEMEILQFLFHTLSELEEMIFLYIDYQVTAVHKCVKSFVILTPLKNNSNIMACLHKFPSRITYGIDVIMTKLCGKHSPVLSFEGLHI